MMGGPLTTGERPGAVMRQAAFLLHVGRGFSPGDLAEQ
jgi:hypothetical protein